MLSTPDVKYTRCDLFTIFIVTVGADYNHLNGIEGGGGGGTVEGGGSGFLVGKLYHGTLEKGDDLYDELSDHFPVYQEYGFQL